LLLLVSRRVEAANDDDETTSSNCVVRWYSTGARRLTSLAATGPPTRRAADRGEALARASGEARRAGVFPGSSACSHMLPLTIEVGHKKVSA
jgi:hypothetical protein